MYNQGDFSSQLKGCTVFSTLDLKNGYLQVPLEKSAVPKTAIITPFSLFEFLRMPFGLKNAEMIFRQYMDRIFSSLDFVFIYIDDILVATFPARSTLYNSRRSSTSAGWLAWSSTSPSAPLAALLWTSLAT